MEVPEWLRSVQVSERWKDRMAQLLHRLERKGVSLHLNAADVVCATGKPAALEAVRELLDENRDDLRTLLMIRDRGAVPFTLWRPSYNLPEYAEMD